MSERPSPPVAVLRGGAIGDFVLTLPAIAALRQAHPGCPLWIAGHGERARLARPDRIFDADGPTLLPLYTASEPPAAPHPLHGVEITVAYVPGADEGLAERLRALTGGEAWVLDPRPPPRFAGHVTDHLLGPLLEHGLPVQDPVPHIDLRPEDYQYADGLEAVQVARGAPPLICLHPGSGGAHKCWPGQLYAELAAGLMESGIRCAVVLGPVEEERTPDPSAALPPGACAARPPDLLALAGLLERADLFVGNDSGPGHIAAAVGTPTLSLFGPTDPRRWAPRGAHGRVLRAPGGDLRSLGLDSVQRAALQVLEGAGGTEHGS